MLSSAKIGTASWRYYTDSVACAATEYYLGVGEAPGRWHGRGLDYLGLQHGAVVGEAELEALFARALHPVTGQRLGRAWRADGVTGFDLTFSAPKTVSALWALGSEGVGAAREAHRAAVHAALGYLDTHAGLSRRGTDGVEQISTGGLSAACFEHRTSRCADPQLHTHALVINKVRCADGMWRTLDATELYHHKKSAGMIYQAALRDELSARAGVVFEPMNEHGQAEIVGVSAGLLKLWSKRTAAIETDAEPKIEEYEKALGRSLTFAERASVVKTSVLKTRPGKSGHPDASVLQDAWVDEAARAGYSAEGVVAAVRSAALRGSEPTAVPAAVPLEAIRAAEAARASFSRADVAGLVAARLPVAGRSAAESLAQVEAFTDQALGLGEAVSVGRHPHGVTPRASDERWAGRQVLAAEAKILSLADGGRRAGYGEVPPALLDETLAGCGLDESQRAAVRALAGGGDFLSVLTAPAGAGKTTTLGTATQSWQAAGYRVLGLAPSARAAAELAAATGGHADTLAKWLHSHSTRRTFHPDPRAAAGLDAATVVVVDEASMASTLDLLILVGEAARKSAKVVLVGDPAQIGVVNGPGGMLAALAGAGHGIELTGVHRFREDWEREASLALRAGDPGILTWYQMQSRLHPCSDGDAAHEAVHKHWAALRADGIDALVMARTRADVDALNTRARAAAVSAGDLTGLAVRHGDRDWQTGDLLRARRNNRHLQVGEGHVRNGDRYRVLTADPSGLLVEDLTGRGRVLLPADYVAAHAEYGWASTIDAAQGPTFDVGLVLIRPGLDREHLYVAMTRGRDANHAYVVPDRAEAPDQHHLGPTHGDARAAMTPDEQAVDVLSVALAKSGAQDAGHTLLDNARTRALDDHRREAAERAEQQRQAAPTIPPQHTETAALLTQRREELAHLGRRQDHHRREIHRAESELTQTSRFSRGHRRDLQALIDAHGDALKRTEPEEGRLERNIENLGRQVTADTRQREIDARTRDNDGVARRGTSKDRNPLDAELSAPKPTQAAAIALTRVPGGRLRREVDNARHAEHRRRRSHDLGRGHDGPGIGM